MMTTDTIKGTARVGRRTKDLTKFLHPGDIAVIDHEDLDEVAADGLVQARVKAVVNARSSMTGLYPNRGPFHLLQAGIPIIDGVGETVLDQAVDGETIVVRDAEIFLADGPWIGSGRRLTQAEATRKLAEARENLNAVVRRFVDNTLEYAQREKVLFQDELHHAPLPVSMAGRHVLVVVRGQGYRDDLAAVRSYVSEVQPVLIGVDGGADALVENGYRPDLIIGDMDSVSNKTLRCGAHLVVHAYPDGKAPGLSRIERLGLGATVIPAPGTSEDLAMLVAYEDGAELIVIVGGHSNVVDFLEKGRKGMASTFLVRLKVGSILVDAKGVSRLYRSRPRGRDLVQLGIAALVPILIVAALSDRVRTITRLLVLKVRLALGW